MRVGGFIQEPRQFYVIPPRPGTINFGDFSSPKIESIYVRLAVARIPVVKEKI